MPRKLATVRTIKDVQPIPEADAIEKVQIDGWWCVSKKGEFKVGDKCVYFEIDSFLPMVEQFAFLAGRGTKKMLCDSGEIQGYRLKTVRLRGQLSQGLALPVSAFREVDESMDDVTELLNVILYEPPIPACLSGEVAGAFPKYIPKTDEERVQNLQELLDKYRGRSFTVTEKLDGTSSSFFSYEDRLGVCGRNWELKENEKSTYWKMFHKYNLKDVLQHGFAIQGEIIGESIQGNPLKIKGQELRVFYIWDINAQRHLFTKEMIETCNKFGLLRVPIIDDNFILNHTIDELLELAEGKSKLCPSANREGIVFVLNRTEGDDCQHKVSFKAIANSLL